MKVLLHICCAPCSIYPVKRLKAGSLDVMGFFYRHNIHPYTECLKRQEALQAYTRQIDLRVIYQEGYEMEEQPTRRHPDKVRRFERAKPNQLWQTDFTI